jgi:hypothetical protein
MTPLRANIKKVSMTKKENGKKQREKMTAAFGLRVVFWKAYSLLI